jgi:hypothetical protein
VVGSTVGGAVVGVEVVGAADGTSVCPTNDGAKVVGTTDGVAVEGAPVGTGVGMPVITAALPAPPMDPPRVVVRVMAAVVAKSVVLATRVAMVRVDALLEETAKVTRMELLMVTAVRRRVATAVAEYRLLPDSASVIVRTVTENPLPP